ncbi:guanylate kinase [Xanthobacter autotrophicus]|uniref:Guanylate kinase n=3 Tax=Xanthobacter TaxID=279 RepID=A0A6C1KHY1_XANAU|nr:MULTISPECIES: guanylate kinase [Xanthobacter]MCG5236005.1 guanylate kinase [Xanthobacter oligotrophicus]MDI4657075.1 guanylate kinase [Xanthobacter autotrophicus]TLX42734.1 guanylate kinase [Xanthobacter autotrophicus]
MLVLSSPSGAGKTTLSRKLLASDDRITMSVSVTTRPPRPGEVDGKDYYFVDVPTFHRMRDEGELLEHAVVFDNLYGTPRPAVELALSAGRDVLFDIDWQGTQQLGETAQQDLVKVFLLPPTAADLEQRLRSRAQDSEEVVHQRMAKASDEISHYTEYDYIIINHEVDDSLVKLTAILQAERLKRRRLTGLSSFVKGLRDAL